jgi:glycosyltransferase involved in cell wall biosynthesis
LERNVLAVVTHLPNENNYHAKRFEVIQACLLSMTQGVIIPHSLIVWDNGSEPRLREWIQRIIKPAVFIQSENIGKSAARKMIAQMLPPKTILAYSDDDIMFYPDWLRPQLDILEHFPNVACVTGYPVRTAFRWGIENTLRWAKQNGEIKFFFLGSGLGNPTATRQPTGFPKSHNHE